MFRLSCTLFLLLTVSAVVAAPAPKDGWERPVDPDNDCKFDIKDGTVTIELPGGDHELAPKRKRFNAPRLLREVEGDFVMQVRLCATFRPSAKSNVEGEEPRVAAGLVLMPTEESYIRLEYGAYRRKGEQDNYFSSRLWGEKFDLRGEADFILGRRTPSGKQAPPANEERIYLRFEREGNCVRKVYSLDGERRYPTITVDCKTLPNKLKVGLAAYSTSTEPFKVRFDQFKLTRNQKKSK
jgi:hypothetical protein